MRQWLWRHAEVVVLPLALLSLFVGKTESESYGAWFVRNFVAIAYFVAGAWTFYRAIRVNQESNRALNKWQSYLFVERSTALKGLQQVVSQYEALGLCREIVEVQRRIEVVEAAVGITRYRPPEAGAKHHDS